MAFLLGSAALACRAALPGRPGGTCRNGAFAAYRREGGCAPRPARHRRSRRAAADAASQRRRSCIGRRQRAIGRLRRRPARHVVAAAGGGGLQRRDQRGWAFEAIATDGYGQCSAGANFSTATHRADPGHHRAGWAPARRLRGPARPARACRPKTRATPRAQPVRHRRPRSSACGSLIRVHSKGDRLAFLS